MKPPFSVSTHPQPVSHQESAAPAPSQESGPRITEKGKRPRVLVIAEAANPVLTSAALVGWSCAQAIRSVADAHIVTEWRNREDFLKAGLIEGQDFTAINARASQGLAWKIATFLRGGKDLGWTTYAIFTALAYPFFERSLLKHFRPALERGEYDLVHRVLPLSPMTPSVIAAELKALRIPFVLGPLNGGVPWPAAFRHIAKAEKEWAGKLRSFAKYLPGARATRRHASAILAGARSVLKEVHPQDLARTIFLPENAIELERFPYTERPAPVQPLRIAFVGRLVPLKGVDMLIEAALPLVKAGQLLVDIIGEGPERPRLTQLAEGQPGILLDGAQPHAQLHQRLRLSHAFAFPSVREFGGGAVLEAMALGLPPIVLDHGGPPELVPLSAGYHVPMTDRPRIIADMRQLLQSLVADPSQLLEKGRAARAHVEQYYTWPQRGQQLLEVYRWVLGQRSSKPDWGIPFGIPTAPSQPTSAPPHYYPQEVPA